MVDIIMSDVSTVEYSLKKKEHPRKIGGENYYTHTYHLIKSQAEHQAIYIRRNLGYKARVVPYRFEGNTHYKVMVRRR